MRRWHLTALAALVALALHPIAAAIETVADDFNRADNNDIGSNWSVAGTSVRLGLVGNEVRGSALDTSSDEYLNTPSIGANQWAKVTVSSFPAGGTAFAGAASRYAASVNQGYVAYAKAGDDNVAVFNASAGSDVATAASGAVSTGGFTLAIVSRDTMHGAYVNNAFHVGGSSATSASGQPGLFAWPDVSVAEVEMDDFSAGDLPITFVAAGTEGEAASGNVSPGWPSGVQWHDYVVCAVHSSDQVSHSMASPWAQIAQGNGGGTTSRLSVWSMNYKGLQPSMTVTHSSGNGIIAGCAAFRSAKSGYYVTLDQTGSISTGTDGTIEHTSITPTQDLALELVIDGAADDNARTAIGGYTPLLEDSSGGTQNAFIGTLGATDESVSIWLIDAFAAATPAVTVTQAASDPYAGLQVSLKVVPLSVPGLINSPLRVSQWFPRRPADLFSLAFAQVP